MTVDLGNGINNKYSIMQSTYVTLVYSFPGKFIISANISNGLNLKITSIIEGI